MSAPGFAFPRSHVPHSWHFRYAGVRSANFCKEHGNEERKKIGMLISRSWTFINMCENVSCMWQVMLYVVSSIWQNVCHVPSILFNFFQETFIMENSPTSLNSTGKIVLSRNEGTRECKFWNRGKQTGTATRERGTQRQKWGTTGTRAHPYKQANNSAI